MSRYGITFGAHTYTHPILTKIPLDEAFQEISRSKNRIENVLQQTTSAFCYPNGKKCDFDENIKAIVKECGFICAMSMIYGINNSNSDRYALRRMAVRGSFSHFLQDVSGFGALRNKLREK